MVGQPLYMRVFRLLLWIWWSSCHHTTGSKIYKDRHWSAILWDNNLCVHARCDIGKPSHLIPPHNFRIDEAGIWKTSLLLLVCLPISSSSPFSILVFEYEWSLLWHIQICNHRYISPSLVPFKIFIYFNSNI